MFKIITNKDLSILHFEVCNKISSEEIKELVNITEERIKEYKKVKMICVLRHFKGYDSIGSFLEDLKFGLGHLDSFSHIAIVGDNRLDEFLTKLYKIMKAEVKYFDMEDLEKAVKWIEHAEVTV